MDTKTQAAQARSGLNLDVPAWNAEALVDALKQEFHTQAEMGCSTSWSGGVAYLRMHLESAAVLADVLSRYYQSHQNEALATEWMHRALRYHTQARKKLNSIVQNIGAEMP